MTVLFPAQLEPAYLEGLTPPQRRRFELLRSKEPSEVRTDLVCGDCGAALLLRLGRYGRFYGCVQYETTGCRGGISAFDDGTPKGWPGDSETRAARKMLVETIGRSDRSLWELGPDESPLTPYGFRNRYQTLCAVVGRDPKDGLPVGELNKDQCEKALEVLAILAKRPKTRYDHLRLESLLPGDD